MAPPPDGPPPPAEGYQISDEGVLTVEHMALDEGGAARLAAIFRRCKAAVEQALQLPVPPRPHAILAPNDAQFERRFQELAGVPPPGAVLAVAFPRLDLIVVRESGIQEGTQASLEQTLRHELVHLALGPLERQRGERLPKWLNEGLAEWAAGRRLTPEERNQVAGWARSGQLPLLSALEEHFPSHDQAMARAYTISLAYVSWLEERHGQGTLRRLLRQLEAGATLDAALEHACGVSMAADLEPAWHEELSQEHSFWLGLLLGVDVWAWTALLAVVAIVLHVIRSRRLKRQLALAELREDEEEAAREAQQDDPSLL